MNVCTAAGNTPAGNPVIRTVTVLAPTAIDELVRATMAGRVTPRAATSDTAPASSVTSALPKPLLAISVSCAGVTPSGTVSNTLPLAGIACVVVKATVKSSPERVTAMLLNAAPGEACARPTRSESNWAL